MEFKQDGLHWKRYSTGDKFFEVEKVLFEIGKKFLGE